MLASTYIHPHFNKQFLALYKASILLLEDGFSFIIEDKHQDLILYYAESRFENKEKEWNDVYYAQYLNDFLQSDEVFTLAYSSCRVLILNDAYALVPQALYSADQVKKLLMLQLNSVENLSTFSNALPYFDMQLVAGISENVTGVLQQWIPGGRLYHAGSTLLRMASEGTGDGPQVAGLNLLITKHSFLLSFVAEHQLITSFAQSLSNPGEVAYYLVNIQQQYQHQYGKLKLAIGGYHPEIQKIKEILALYFEKVEEFRFEKPSVGLTENLPVEIRTLYQLLQACE